jgi:hypothetical protein
MLGSNYEDTGPFDDESGYFGAADFSHIYYARTAIAGNLQSVFITNIHSHRTSTDSSSEKRSTDTSALRSGTEHSEQCLV